MNAIIHPPTPRPTQHSVTALNEEIIMNGSDHLPIEARQDHNAGGHGGHGWMMVCCVPMLVIAMVLVAAGVLSAGFLLLALMCTAMMVLMMRGMRQGEGM